MKILENHNKYDVIIKAILAVFLSLMPMLSSAINSSCDIENDNNSINGVSLLMYKSIFITEKLGIEKLLAVAGSANTPPYQKEQAVDQLQAFHKNFMSKYLSHDFVECIEDKNYQKYYSEAMELYNEVDSELNIYKISKRHDHELNPKVDTEDNEGTYSQNNFIENYISRDISNIVGIKDELKDILKQQRGDFLNMLAKINIDKLKKEKICMKQKVSLLYGQLIDLFDDNNVQVFLKNIQNNVKKVEIGIDIINEIEVLECKSDATNEDNQGDRECLKRKLAYIKKFKEVVPSVSVGHSNHRVMKHIEGLLDNDRLTKHKTYGFDYVGKGAVSLVKSAYDMYAYACVVVFYSFSYVSNSGVDSVVGLGKKTLYFINGGDKSSEDTGVNIIPVVDVKDSLDDSSKKHRKINDANYNVDEKKAVYVDARDGIQTENNEGYTDDNNEIFINGNNEDSTNGNNKDSTDGNNEDSTDGNNEDSTDGNNENFTYSDDEEIELEADIDDKSDEEDLFKPTAKPVLNDFLMAMMALEDKIRGRKWANHAEKQELRKKVKRIGNRASMLFHPDVNTMTNIDEYVAFNSIKSVLINIMLTRK